MGSNESFTGRVDREWLYEVARRCQILLGEIEVGSGQPPCAAARLAGLLSRASREEQLLLHGVLLETVVGATPAPPATTHRLLTYVQKALDAAWYLRQQRRSV